MTHEYDDRDPTIRVSLTAEEVAQIRLINKFDQPAGADSAIVAGVEAAEVALKRIVASEASLFPGVRLYGSSRHHPGPFCPGTYMTCESGYDDCACCSYRDDCRAEGLTDGPGCPKCGELRMICIPGDHLDHCVNCPFSAECEDYCLKLEGSCPACQAGPCLRCEAEVVIRMLGIRAGALQLADYAGHLLKPLVPTTDLNLISVFAKGVAEGTTRRAEVLAEEKAKGTLVSRSHKVRFSSVKTPSPPPPTGGPPSDDLNLDDISF